MFAELDHRYAPERAPVVRRTGSRFFGARHRSGVTLIELLVVLAILVVLAALVSIPIANVMESQALTQGADILRARLAQTRVEAMRTGKIHLLEYAPETNQFGVAVWEGEVLEGETMSASGLVSGGPRKIYLGGGSLDGDEPEFGAATEFLPDGVFFVSGQTMADQRTLDAAQGSGGSGSQASGAAPVYFYPDGTTSKSSIVLGNAGGSALVVTMRGLTGFATVSEPQSLQGVGR
ncbi:MAG TPA: prepilin-type N-terminal cleavage/methylation domain-containing protein [Pirellulaceae bacterium]|jgi:prepilin-type N-terminal cleavage/methylation domain-containing protein|nr:prepilin-type N-terminal cleavage/methylation domain-containing protein [Pirellulaceae bacterium]